MSPEQILILMIVILSFDFVMERVLSFLNGRNRGQQIPEELEGIYDQEKYEKSQQYQAERERFGQVTATFSFLMVVTLLATGAFGLLDDWLREYAAFNPIRTLMFFELADNARVLELFPGAGWYTRILSDVLADEGELFVALGTSRVREIEKELAPIQILETGTRLIPTATYGIFDLDSVDLGVDSLDLIVTFRNLHNLTPEAREKLLAAAYAALRPGGRLGVVDHTRRHMEPDGVENRRRMDPLQVVLEVTQAGFIFTRYSDLHYRSDDELEYEVGSHSVAGNTDRFTFLFSKPE